MVFKNELAEKLSVLKRSIESFDFILNHQEFYVDNYVEDIKNKIDLHREELILTINKLSNETIQKLERYNHDCLNNLSNLTQVTNFEKENLDAFKQDLFLLEKEVTESELKDCENHEKIKNRLDEITKHNKSKMERFKSFLKLNKTCIFDPNNYYLSNNLFGQLFIKENSDSDLFHFGQRIDFNQINLMISSNVEIINNEYISYGTLNGMIFIYTVEKLRLVKDIEAHECHIYALKSTSKGHLISFSTDQSIKVWSLKNFNCLHTFTNRKKVFRSCLGLDDNLLICFMSSPKHLIKIWNLLSGNLIIRVNNLHSQKLTGFINIKNGEFISSSIDKTIKLWNLNNEFEFICLKEIKEDMSIYSLNCFSNDTENILYTTSDGFVKTCNTKTGEQIQKFSIQEAHGIVEYGDIKFLSDSFIISVVHVQKGPEQSHSAMNIWNLKDGSLIQSFVIDAEIKNYEIIRMKSTNDLIVLFQKSIDHSVSFLKIMSKMKI